MNFKNFILAAKKIVELLNQYDNIPNYTELTNTIINSRSAPTPELQTIIHELVSKITTNNSQLQSALDLTPYTYNVIELISANSYIGEGANDNINQIISNDIFNAPAKIEEFVSILNTTRDQLNNISSEVDKLGIIFEQSDKGLISLQYNGEYNVENTDDLQRRLADIEGILRAFARLSKNSKSFEKPQIATISKSSPLIIDIGNGIAISSLLVLIGRTVKWSMDRVEQANRIRIQCEELKQKKMTTATMVKEFKKLENSKTSEAEIKKHVEATCKEASPDVANGAENENKKDLVEATKLLIKMIEGGVIIKVYPPPKSDENKGNDEIQEVSDLSILMSQTYKKILENNLKLKEIAESTKVNKGSEPTAENAKEEKKNGTE